MPLLIFLCKLDKDGHLSDFGGGGALVLGSLLARLADLAWQVRDKARVTPSQPARLQSPGGGLAFREQFRDGLTAATHVRTLPSFLLLSGNAPRTHWPFSKRNLKIVKRG